jgi:hypothetical protein
MSITVSIYTDDDHEIVCTCTIYEGRPGRMYMPNGDPGYPDEPPECVIEFAMLNGKDIADELTEFQREEIEIKAFELSEDCAAAEAESQWEMLALHGTEG